MRNFRAEKISRMIASYLCRGDSVLDIGSGTGRNAWKVRSDSKVTVYCTDIVDYFQYKKKLPFFRADALHLPLQTGSVDIALLVFVLHHTKDHRGILREAKRVARRRVIVFEDEHTGPLSRAVLIAVDYVSNRVRSAKVPVPYTFRTRQQWVEQFAAEGLTVENHVRYPSRFPLIWHNHFVLNAGKL